MIYLQDILKEVTDANLLENDLSRIIYVDLDGVLVDFDSGFEAISSGVKKTDYIKKHGMSDFWKLINSQGQEWWENLEWMSDGTKLWSAIENKNVKVLTSGSTRNTGTMAINGKKKWVADHLGPIETIVVNSSHEKQKYARPGDILIDDLYSNISEWTVKKGTGILHRNADDTINKLNDVINTQTETYGYSWSNI
jgi:hypothetical protein